MVQNVQLRIFQHDLLYGYKIKRLVGAPGIIFVLMNHTRIRQEAPPSDLGQRIWAARCTYYVVCDVYDRYEDCVDSLDTGFN